MTKNLLKYDFFARQLVSAFLSFHTQYRKKLPSFTLAYFPDVDVTVHKNGPKDLKSIEKADKALQDLLKSFSS
jgi:predicted AlkP superfamily pyrophosphatase or phosphodiesterase